LRLTAAPPPIAVHFTPDFPLDEKLMRFMLPPGQPASPEDMDRALLMLSLPQASLINGTVLRVDP